MLARFRSTLSSRRFPLAVLSASFLAACGGGDEAAPSSEVEPLGAAPESSGEGAGGAPEPLVVFVTSTRHSAALGGQQGADELCAATAASASLEGSFKAWLSTRETAVAARLRPSSGPYVRTDGVRIADNWSDLLDGSLLAAISVDERGGSASGDVWTGTLGDGSPLLADDCGGFTLGDARGRAQCGNSNATDSRWTQNITPACSASLRVYCFEQ